MSVNHDSGPTITYGIPRGDVATNTNPNAGPNIEYQGDCILDPRYPYGPGTDNKSTQCYSFWNAPYLCLVDAVPSTLSATNIAAAANPANGVAMTLVSVTGGGITVATSIQAPFWKSQASATVTGLLAIDSAMAWNAIGVINSIYDPTKAIARNVRVTAVNAGATGGTVTVVGYDLYGVRMTETITQAAAATTASGKKAFKYILSVTPNYTDTQTISIGTGDLFGFGMRSDQFGYMNIIWNNGFISANTGYLAAVTTDPATAITGDVRGTYGVQSASDGTKRLTVYYSIPPGVGTAATNSSQTGLFGILQA